VTASVNWTGLKERFGERVEAPVMDRLTEIGERHQIDFLIYNPLRMRMFHRYARRDATPVMNALQATFPSLRAYADVGCGSGAYAAEATRRGLRVVGCEKSRVGRVIARRQGVDCQPFDLTRSTPAKLEPGIELTYCFEVAEHLPIDLGDRLVEFLAGAAPVCVFTAAQPGQGGSGHINERPREYWHERFLRHGLEPDQRLTARLVDEFAAAGVQARWLFDNLTVYTAAGRS
jgi:SAM-dependent methyltransferase